MCTLEVVGRAKQQPRRQQLSAYSGSLYESHCIPGTRDPFPELSEGLKSWDQGPHSLGRGALCSNSSTRRGHPVLIFTKVCSRHREESIMENVLTVLLP